MFIKRIFETVNHVIARRGAEKIKYKTSHASFPERVIFNKTSQSNNSNPMEVYCVLFTQDLQACILAALTHISEKRQAIQLFSLMSFHARGINVSQLLFTLNSSTEIEA